MKTSTVLSLLVLAIAFTNCNGNKKVIEDSSSDQLIGKFIVTELNGAKISQDKGMRFEISEINKSIRGSSGCNSFFGDISKEGKTLRITEMNISERYCDDDLMKTERELMTVFNTAGSFKLKKQILTLYSISDNSVILNAVKDTIQ